MKTYMLKSLPGNRRAYGGFRWPTEPGSWVQAPDWRPDRKCGGGLHGLLMGEGDSTLAYWGSGAVWIVAEIDPSAAVDLGGKVKVPSCVVRCAGPRHEATRWLWEHGGSSNAIVGLSMMVGPESTLTGGDNSILTGGEYCKLTGGHRSTLTGGYRCILTGGHCSTLTGGHCSTLTGGDDSTLTGGSYSTLTGGRCSTLTGGAPSKLAGGYGAALTWRVWDGRYRIRTAYVGEDGIKADTPYTWRDGRVVEVK